MIQQEYDNLKTQLNNFLSLSNDWDGYGGMSPSLDIVITSCQILDKIAKLELELPKIMITSSGEIGFYWKTKQHYLEIFIEQKNSFSYLYDGIDNTISDINIEISNDFSSLLISKLNNFKIKFKYKEQK